MGTKFTRMKKRIHMTLSKFLSLNKLSRLWMLFKMWVAYKLSCIGYRNKKK